MSDSSLTRRVRAQSLNARARLRPKGQLTLPEEIRRALRVSEGDDIEFTVADNGAVTVRGYVSVPTDLVWRYTGERAGEADEGPDGRATTRRLPGPGTASPPAEPGPAP